MYLYIEYIKFKSSKSYQRDSEDSIVYYCVRIDCDIRLRFYLLSDRAITLNISKENEAMITRNCN